LLLLSAAFSFSIDLLLHDLLLLLLSVPSASVPPAGQQTELRGRTA
jgi:hypothetical protein